MILLESWSSSGKSEMWSLRPGAWALQKYRSLPSGWLLTPGNRGIQQICLNDMFSQQVFLGESFSLDFYCVCRCVLERLA